MADGQFAVVGRLVVVLVMLVELDGLCWFVVSNF